MAEITESGTLHISEYFTSQAAFEALFDKVSRGMGFKAKTVAEFEEWKKTLRAKLRELLCLDDYETVPLNPVLRETVQCDGFTRYSMLIDVEPHVKLPFYVLVPDELKEGEKRPCVVTTHGHSGAGKFRLAGRKEIPVVAETIGKGKGDYGAWFAREGYITFCVDARGAGERREWPGQGDDPDSFLKGTCRPLNNIALAMGRNVCGMMVWDLMRLIDYIGTRPDCDMKKLVGAGMSGGGHQILWTSAMDDRFKVNVVSGYFYGYKDSLLKLMDNCACNYVPNSWKYIDMCDLGALIAPRPLLIESGDNDIYSGERRLQNVYEQVEITKGAYELFNKPGNLHLYTFAGPHRWDGGDTYEFVRKHLAEL